MRPSGIGFCPVYGGGYVVVDLLFIVAPIACWGSVFGPCFIIQYFVSVSFCNNRIRE